MVVLAEGLVVVFVVPFVLLLLLTLGLLSMLFFLLFLPVLLLLLALAVLPLAVVRVPAFAPVPLTVAGENAYVPGVFQYPVNAVLLKGLVQLTFCFLLPATSSTPETRPALVTRAAPLRRLFALAIVTLRPFAF